MAKKEQPDFNWLKKGVAKAEESITDRLNSSDAIYESGNRRGSSGRGGRDDEGGGRGQGRTR